MLASYRITPFNPCRPLLTPLVKHATRKLSICSVAEKHVVNDLVDPSEDPVLGDLTKKLLENDPEMQAQLQKYQEAIARVDRAKAAAEELDREYARAAKAAALAEKEEELMRRKEAEQMMADAEVAAAEKLLLAAELQSARAEQDRARWSSEISQTAGRVESGKAAVAAVIGGAVGLLPFMLLQEGPAQQGLPVALSLLAAVASCALFGVTYRYAVGSNPQNPHLKGGVVSAFGLVRAAAAGDMLQQAAASTGSSPLVAEVLGPAALYAGQSVLMFAFAATAIEAAFQQGVIKRIDEVPSS